MVRLRMPLGVIRKLGKLAATLEIFTSGKSDQYVSERVTTFIREQAPRERRGLVRAARLAVRRWDVDHDVRQGAGRVLRATTAKMPAVARLASNPRDRLKKKIARMTKVSRRWLIRDVVRFLKTSDLVADGGVKLGMLRILDRALPDSVPAFRTLMLDFSRPLSYEVQFSISAASDIHSTAYLKDFFDMTERCLMVVPKETAMGAYSVGCALGYDEDEGGLAVLLRCAERARYVAGRMGALHGLTHSLDYSNSGQTKTILATLRRLSRTDPSKKVREVCRSCLKGELGAPKPEEIKRRLSCKSAAKA